MVDEPVVPEVHDNSKIIIRNETDADVSAITDVTVAAFKTLAISNHTEQFIVAALRAAQALTVSLGFKNTPELVLEGVPQEVFFALSFGGHTPQGAVTFHDGFKANS